MSSGAIRGKALFRSSILNPAGIIQLGTLSRGIFRFRILCCLLVCVPAIFLFFPNARAAANKNVLILHSYHQGFKWTDDITRGIVSALEPASGETRVHIEYMGTKWVNDSLYFQELRQILKHKYSKTRFDLIISSDNDAFDFLRDHRDEVFGRIPVVFCGVNYFRDSDLIGKSLFTGISETADLRDSLDLALRLHPSAKKIFIINDTSISGVKVQDEFVKLAPLYRGRAQFEFEKNTDLEIIRKDVEVLSPDTLIFYTFFYGSIADKPYENRDSISLISRHARVPVYGAWDFNLGHGIVGGKLTSGYDQGDAAGRMGLRILKGEGVEDIPVVRTNRTRYMFDYRQLERFGIKKSDLPTGSIVINEPESFHKVPNELIWGTVIGIAGLSGLILLLLLVIRQRRRSEELLQKAHDGLEMIVAERTRDLSDLNEKLCADIMERRKTEEALRNSQSLLNSIIESNPDLLAVIDRDLRIVHSNWHGKYKSVPPELREKKPHCYEAFYPGQDGPCENCHVIEAFRTGKPVFVEKHDPHMGHVEIRAFPICDDSGSVFMVAEHIHDISERKRMEKEMIKAQKLESLGVLAGGIAHDFNNLLTGILGNISLAKMYVDPAAKVCKRLEEAEKASERARDLTRQLLTFSKGGTPVKNTASMAQILTDCANFALRGANVKCDFDLSGDLWAVEVDEGQMSQVVNNLIINAGHAMPDGGIITVRAENVMIGCDTTLPLQKGRYIWISIQDKGIGIPEEHLPKIFDPYFTTKEKGSGLGLATVYSIIQNHDGYIGVESTVGDGTVFHLYLPANGTGVLTESVVEDERKPRSGSGRILVMDDDEAIRELACEILDNLGYQAEVCSDGMDAIRLYREALESGNPYTAVIMDLTVPGGVGGKETMMKLLDIDSAVKGIVSSGYSNDPILAHYREYGFSGVVTKPYKVNELYDALQLLV